MANRGRAYTILDGIRFVMGNVVLDSAGEWWAVYRLGGITYHHLPRGEKFEEFGALESLFASLSHRIKILSLVRNFEQEQLVPRMKALYQRTPGAPDTREQWDAIASEVGDSVGTMAPYDRDFFVALNLRPRTESPMQAIAAAARKLNVLLRRLTGTPQTFRLQDALDAGRESDRAEGLFGSLSVSPASEREIQWLIMRGAYRAVGEPPLLDYWRPKYVPEVAGEAGPFAYYEPNATDIRGLVGDIPWEAGLGQLTFFHGHGRFSHQKFLSACSVPSGDPFPNREWLMRQLPVDECIDLTVIPSTVSEKQRESKARSLRGQQKHTVESEDVIDFELAEAEAEDKALQILHAQGKPRLIAYVTVGVAATKEDDLDMLVDATKKELKGYRVELANDWGSQVEAFADFMPAGPRRLSDYPQHVSSLAISGGMPHGRFSLGDGRGFIIGKPLQNNGLVNWDIKLPMMEQDSSGAAAFVGSLGGGKSVNMYFLSALAACAGIPSLIFDPKGDTEKFDNIEELRGGIKKIRMGEDQMAQMPIFRLLPPEKADKVEGLVTSALIQLMEAEASQDGGRELRQVIRLVVSEYLINTAMEDWRPSGLRELFERYARRSGEHSRRKEAAESVVDSLGYFANNKLTHTIFSDQAHEGFAAHEQELRDPITLIQTWDLPLPKPGAQDVNDRERIGQVVLSVIAAYAIELAGEYRLSDKKPVKIITFDECWRLFASATGQDLIHGLIREGRSQNLVPMIGTQLWSDIPEDIMSLLEVLFFFKQSDHGEIQRGLSAMGMDEADENLINNITHYKPGMCLHRDVYGNIGAMQWKVQPERWFHALKTTAKNQPDDSVASRELVV